MQISINISGMLYQCVTHFVSYVELTINFAKLDKVDYFFLLTYTKKTRQNYPFTPLVSTQTNIFAKCYKSCNFSNLF